MKTPFAIHTEAFANLEKARASYNEAQALAADAGSKHEAEINAAAAEGDAPSKATLTRCAESSHLASIASRRIEMSKAELEKATAESNASFRAAAEFLRGELSNWINANSKSEMERILPSGGNAAQQQAAQTIIAQSEEAIRANGLLLDLLNAKNDEHGRMYLQRAADLVAISRG